MDLKIKTYGFLYMLVLTIKLINGRDDIKVERPKSKNQDQKAQQQLKSVSGHKPGIARIPIVLPNEDQPGSPLGQEQSKYVSTDPPEPDSPYATTFMAEWPYGVVTYYIDGDSYELTNERNRIANIRALETDEDREIRLSADRFRHNLDRMLESSQDSNEDETLQRRIQKAMSVVEASSCVIFKEETDKPRGSNVSWLHFTNPNQQRHCSHDTAKGDDGDIIIVLGIDCLKTRDVLHSLLHGLGFKDEVSHPHRDQYIRVLWENVQPSYRPLFRVRLDKAPYKLVEYDPMSIMHFHDRAYSENGGLTIAPVMPGLVINPSDKLSQLDVMKLRIMFGHECNKRKVGDLIENCKNVLYNQNSPSATSLNTEEESDDKQINADDDDDAQQLNADDNDDGKQLNPEKEDDNQQLDAEKDDDDKKLNPEDNDENQQLDAEKDDDDKKLNPEEKSENQQLDAEKDDDDKKINSEEKDDNQQLDAEKDDDDKKLNPEEKDDNQQLDAEKDDDPKEEEDANQQLNEEEDGIDQKLNPEEKDDYQQLDAGRDYYQHLDAEIDDDDKKLNPKGEDDQQLKYKKNKQKNNDKLQLKLKKTKQKSAKIEYLPLTDDADLTNKPMKEFITPTGEVIEVLRKGRRDYPLHLWKYNTEKLH